MKKIKGVDDIKIEARIVEKMEIRFVKDGVEYVAKLTNRKCIGIYRVYEEFPEIERWEKVDTLALCKLIGVDTINELIGRAEALSYRDTKNKYHVNVGFSNGQIVV